MREMIAKAFGLAFDPEKNRIQIFIASGAPSDGPFDGGDLWFKFLHDYPQKLVDGRCVWIHIYKGWNTHKQLLLFPLPRGMTASDLKQAVQNDDRAQIPQNAVLFLYADDVRSESISECPGSTPLGQTTLTLVVHPPGFRMAKTPVAIVEYKGNVLIQARKPFLEVDKVGNFDDFSDKVERLLKDPLEGKERLRFTFLFPGGKRVSVTQDADLKHCKQLIDRLPPRGEKIPELLVTREWEKGH
jgi:hypothetical protein